MLADFDPSFLVLVLVVVASVILGMLRYNSRVKGATSHLEAPLKNAIEMVNTQLNQAREKLSVEDQRTQSGQGSLTSARIGELRQILDVAEKSINEAKQGNNIEARAEALTRASVALMQHTIGVNLDKAEALAKVTQMAVAANDRGDKSYPVAAIQQLQDLTASAKRELASIVPKASSDVKLAGQAIQRAVPSLTEASAIAKALGLLNESPTAEKPLVL